jgi:hypothetical protein
MLKELYEFSSVLLHLLGGVILGALIVGTSFYTFLAIRYIVFGDKRG